MSLRLTLIAHAATDATRRTRFPLDEALEPRGLQAATALAGNLGRVDQAWSSPRLGARQTAEALGLAPSIETALSDIDLGRWAGRPLEEVAAEDPSGLTSWMKDPMAAPHGGESVSDLLCRVETWLGRMQRSEGRIVAVTHAAVIRAAVVILLEANPRSFWKIDVEPLCFARLLAHEGHWRLRELTRRHDLV